MQCALLASPTVLGRLCTRMSAALTLVALFAGCTPWTRSGSPRLDPKQPAWLSVTFDAARPVMPVTSLIAYGRSWDTLQNVRAVGGQVLEHRADSLLIRPTYMITRKPTGADQVVRRKWKDQASLPDIIVVETEPGTAIGAYRYPKPTSERVTEAITLYAVPAWLAVLFAHKIVRLVGS